MTSRGRPWEQYRDKMVEAFQYYTLSSAFGWTPEQIDEMDFDKKMMYLSIIRGISEKD